MEAKPKPLDKFEAVIMREINRLELRCEEQFAKGEIDQGQRDRRLRVIRAVGKHLLGKGVIER